MLQRVSALLLALFLFNLLLVAPAQAVTYKLHWTTDLNPGTLYGPWSSNFSIAENGEIMVTFMDGSDSGQGVKAARYSSPWDATTPQHVWPDGAELVMQGSGTPYTFPNVPGNAHIISDGAGGAFVSYVALNSGPPMMYVQRVLADGSLAWGSVGLMIGPNDFNYELGGSLFPDGEGGLYVMWHSPAQIQVQRIDADGNKAWGTEGTVLSTAGTFSERTPDFIQVGESDFIIFWVDTALDVVMAQKINGAGEIQWAAGGVEVVAINDAITHEVTGVSDNQGGAYITTSQGKIARIASNGSLPWGTDQFDYEIEYVLGSLSGSYQSNGAHGKNNMVIADSDGNAYIYGVDSSDNLAIQKISPTGESVWSPSVKTYPSAANIAQTINGDIDANDVFTLFWNRSTDDAQLVQFFDTEGNELLASPVQIGDSTDADIAINKVATRNAGTFAFSYVEFTGSIDTMAMQMMSLLYQIEGLPAGLNAENTDGDNIEVGSANGLTGTAQTVRIRDSATDTVIADIPVDIDQDLDWSGITVTTDPDTGVTVVEDVEQLPGYSTDEPYTVYIPKEVGDETLLMCPNETESSDVNGTCTGGVELTEADADVSVVTIDGQEYWQVDEVTGNNGFASGGTVTEAPSDDGNSGSSSSSSSRSRSRPTTCNASKPVGLVDLFQIDRSGNTAKLYFTPVNDHVESYHVVFGYKEGDERFGGINMKAQNENKGVQSILIDHLDPKSPYSFKVVSVNGCAIGDWSSWLSVDRVQAKTSIFYRYWDKVKNIF